MATNFLLLAKAVYLLIWQIVLATPLAYLTLFQMLSSVLLMELHEAKYETLLLRTCKADQRNGTRRPMF
jgi:hypothetical protein